MSPPLAISVVVPIFDEQPSLEPLQAEIARSLDAFGRPWELLYVDDRSRDGSFRTMLELRRRDPRVRVIRLRMRCGQTAAMQAGFDHARGRIVVTLDGDLQNDPADIPALVQRLEEGYDVAAGWRKQRYDGFVLRRLPSVIANRLIQFVTGVRIHDTGCTLKAFRRELLLRMPIYAEQHRFLPAISAGAGARVCEVIVNHRPRRFGRSKYGLGRATRVLLDLLAVKMMASFSQRPLSFFAGLATPFALAALVVFSYSLYHGFALQTSWGLRLVYGFTLLFLSVPYFLLLGFLAELAVKASGMHGTRHARVMVQTLEPRAHGRTAG
ncbi:MAG: glycosyltransferase family 2 protein [Planctomycetes bacterium]|nr:glycosyltransferase family 2 protein [Planctomycetota bacterium]